MKSVSVQKAPKVVPSNRLFEAVAFVGMIRVFANFFPGDRYQHALDVLFSAVFSCIYVAAFRTYGSAFLKSPAERFLLTLLVFELILLLTGLGRLSF